MLGYNSGSTGTEDKWFIFKNKNALECFINLYDDYGTYINQYLNKKEGDKVFEDYPETTRPEDIFPYHFKKYNLKNEKEPIHRISQSQVDVENSMSRTLMEFPFSVPTQTN